MVTSSALLLTPMRSDAQVDMKVLSQVAESCQKDTFSPDYYKKINFSRIGSNGYKVSFCIDYRYHYLLILSKFPWLASSGELVEGASTFGRNTQIASKPLR